MAEPSGGPVEFPETVSALPASPLADPAGHGPILAPSYEVLGELGRGGTGVVYGARQRGLGRLGALKMILANPHADAVGLLTGSLVRPRSKEERMPPHRRISAGIYGPGEQTAAEVTKGSRPYHLVPVDPSGDK